MPSRRRSGVPRWLLSALFTGAFTFSAALSGEAQTSRPPLVIQPSQPQPMLGPMTAEATDDLDQQAGMRERFAWPRLTWPKVRERLDNLRQARQWKSGLSGLDAFQAPVENWPQPLGGQLTVGIRLTTYSLADDKRGDDDPFYGHVNELSADTDTGFLRNLYADWYLAEWQGMDFGAGLAWSKVKADTVNIEGHSDGAIEAGGPVLTAIVRYPIELWVRGYRWTVAPSAGLGLSYMMTDFDHASWWHFGFGANIRTGGTEEEAQADYDDWVDRGSPADEIVHTRTVSTDDAFGWVFQCGARASHGPIGVDLFLRYMGLDVDGTYTQEWGPGQTVDTSITYPLSHWTTGIGISYEL